MRKVKMSKQYKVLLIVSIVLIVATIGGIVLSIFLTEEENSPEIITGEENLPIEYSGVNKLIFNTKISNILSNQFFVVDKNHHIGNMLLDAMSKARIPTEKMLLFADYLESLANVIKENGFSIKTGQFNINNNSNEKILETINTLITNFFEETQMTDIELGRFIYQFILGNIGNENYKTILQTLGEEDFTYIFSNAVGSYNIIADAFENGVEQSQARSLQALVYSFGSNLLQMIDKLGLSNTEILIGINYGVELKETALTEDEYEDLQYYFDAIDGKIGNIIFILGSIMRNVDASTFETIFEYLQLDNKETKLAKDMSINFHKNICEAIKQGIENSFINSHTTNINSKQTFINEYTTFFVESERIKDIANGEEAFSYDDFQTDIMNKITSFIDCIYLISEIECENLDSITQSEYQEIIDNIDALWTLADFNFENTITIKLINFALRATSLESFMTNNRMALEDIIFDSLNNEQLEEYLELYS